MTFNDNPKIATISGDAHAYLKFRLSADQQLRQGLMSTNHHQSEAFKLGLLAGLAEAALVADQMFNASDYLEEE